MTIAQLDLNDLTAEQLDLLRQLINSMLEIDHDLREILPPAKVKLLKKAYFTLKNNSNYGSIELVMSDGVIQNIKVHHSMR